MWQIINNFLGNIFVIVGLFFFEKIILNTKVKVSKLKLIIDFIFSAVLYTIIMIYFTGIVKTLFMGIVMVFFNKDVFKEKNKKIVFVTFLYLIVLLIMELLGLWFLINILKMSKEFCYNEFAGSVICNIFIQLLAIGTAFLLRNIFRLLAKAETTTQIIIYSILIWICSMMFLYTIVKEYRFSNDIQLYIVSITVLIIVLFGFIKKTIENNNLTNEYDKLLEFMTTYEQDIENQRILRHEAKNELRTIKAKICDHQPEEEIIEYIDEILNDKYEINQEKYAKFGYLPANGIKGLCYFKTQAAEMNGVEVAVNISNKIKKSTIYNLNIKQQRDFGRIMGVFLDNAIEASKESKKKQLGIEAYITKNQEFKMIISNTYNNEVDKNKIGIERFSTKGKNRGHGLLLVQRLTRKNKIFEVISDVQKEIYVQTIIIKKL